ncbi:MAG: SDR family oxidoreductase [Deltaproteobacteria bacterium]|nr:SDR family oxidoreductase [Deltaproteobacteria bacterium]MBW2419533.1 SDR family oxidoreductase [Deltaproteobacteria bacterium]
MLFDKFRLTDRVAIVTGAGRGIGAGIATGFAEAGADVVIGSRTESQLQEVAKEVEAAGRRAAVVAGDLGSRDAMAELVDRAMDEFGRIDIVVNNAGGSMPSPFLGTSEKAFNEALHWNVTTAFNLTQLAVPHMLESGGGNVINIASAVGRISDRGFVAYGTAKAALIHLTKNLAADLAPRIRVNSIAPGAIATSALEMVLRNEELTRKMVEQTPLKRLGEVEDIAAGAVYLASDAASYVTGRVLDIDGGINSANLELGFPDL